MVDVGNLAIKEHASGPGVFQGCHGVFPPLADFFPGTQEELWK